VPIVMMPVANVEDDVIAARRFVDYEQPKRQAERLSAAQQTVAQFHERQMPAYSCRNNLLADLRELYSSNTTNCAIP